MQWGGFSFFTDGAKERAVLKEILLAGTKDLRLGWRFNLQQKNGLKVYMRDPHSFTPMLKEEMMGAPPRSFTLGPGLGNNPDEISKFPRKDAKAYPEFVAYLETLASAIHPLVDSPPVDIRGFTHGSPRKRLAAAKTLIPLVKCGLWTKTDIENDLFARSFN